MNSFPLSIICVVLQKTCVAYRRVYDLQTNFSAVVSTRRCIASVNYQLLWYSIKREY